MKRGSLLKVCMGLALALTMSLSTVFSIESLHVFAQQKEEIAPLPCPMWPECIKRPPEAITINGTVKAIYPPVAVLETDEGELYFRLGPWWFWKEKGYSLNQGEEVEVRGYRFNNYIVPISIKTDKQEIVLRDQDGLPLWRRYKKGRGRMGWGGYGMGMRPRAPLPQR